MPKEEKDEAFERALCEYFEGFIQCYPHLIEKVPFDSKTETWIFKFTIDPNQK